MTFAEFVRWGVWYVKSTRDSSSSPIPVLFPGEYEYIDPIRPGLPETPAQVRRLVPSPELPTGLFFDMPVLGSVSSEFGMRWHPVTGKWKPHRGMDIAAREGTPVEASADGTVSFAGVSAGYGNLVILDHGHGITTYYGHMSAIHVQKGQHVATGECIGAIGHTGLATGPHLHWEIRRNGVAVDPATMS